MTAPIHPTRAPFAQMNEYRVMVLSLGLLLLSLLVLDATAGRIAEDLTLTRRIALLNNLVRGALLFWPVICTPLYKYAKRDQDYADSFSLGLASSITPAVLRCVLLRGGGWFVVFVAVVCRVSRDFISNSKLNKDRCVASYASLLESRFFVRQCSHSW